MYLLTNRINSGYITNLSMVKIPLKKKYVTILNRLSHLNFIDNYNINKEDNTISILLRYYNNKPLIYLETISRCGYNQYKRKAKIKLDTSIDNNITLYSNDQGILFNNEIHILKLGGKSLLKIHLLYKNIIY